MTSQTRDTIALFAIGSAEILAVLYADVDLGDLFLSLLRRFQPRTLAKRLGVFGPSRYQAEI